MDLGNSGHHAGVMDATQAAPTGHEVWIWAGEQFARWRDEGDTAALDALVRALSPRLWHAARAYGLDTERAQDVVQSAWLAMVSHAEAISAPRAIGAWLLTATRREALRTARSAATGRPIDDEEVQRRLPAQPSAEQIALDDHEASTLWHAVATLPERCRRILRVLAFAERPNYAALAAELSMPVGSIGPTRGRCLAKLRDLLEVGR